MSTPLSKCCHAPLRVHSGDEGTCFHVCTKCGKPADAIGDGPTSGGDSHGAPAGVYVTPLVRSDPVPAATPATSPTLAQACAAAASRVTAYLRREYDKGYTFSETELAAILHAEFAPVVERVARERDALKADSLAGRSIGLSESDANLVKDYLARGREVESLRADLARTQAKLEEANERVKVEQSCVAKEAAKVTDLRARLESAQQMLTAGLESAQDKERLTKLIPIAEDYISWLRRNGYEEIAAQHQPIIDQARGRKEEA